MVWCHKGNEGYIDGQVGLISAEALARCTPAVSKWRADPVEG